MELQKPYLMTITPLTYAIFVLVLILFCLSMMALATNWVVYQFPGNNYLYYTPISKIILLFITFTALCRILGVNVMNKEIAVECFIYVLFIMVLTTLTNAIQYTPFQPIDPLIIRLEEVLLHINAASYASLHQQPLLQQSDFIYQLIGLELLVIPIATILLKQYYYLYEYYFLMLLTTVLGYTFYYFFPTTGPASMFHAAYFSAEQLATGQKFYDIHHYIHPSTMAGGMIAMPSFHVIWACLTTYAIRFNPIACAVMVLVNIMVILSCVWLGWHYLLDIVGSFMTVGLAIGIKNVARLNELSRPLHQ